MTEAEMQAKIDEANRKAADANKALEDERKARFAEKVKAHRETVVALLDKSIEEGRILPRTKDRIVNARLFKSDDDVMTAYSLDTVKDDIKSETRADFREQPQAGKRASFSANSNEPDLIGKPVADVLTFRAQAECVRLGGKVDNFDDLVAATGRVLNSDKDLASAYYADPKAAYNPQRAA